MGRIRERSPKVQIIVRGDSGFCWDWLMSWCEEAGVDYILEVARNPRLEARVSSLMGVAKALCERSGQTVKLYSSFQWTTLDSWSRKRWVIAKGEHSRLGSNPRFIVASLPCSSPKEAKLLYRDMYCARGDMENRIKEQQLWLFADRTSARTLRANQVRLYMSSMAYVMLPAIRRIGLQGIELAQAQCGTMRARLQKIGARIRVTARRVSVLMASSCPLAEHFMLALRRLRPGETQSSVRGSPEPRLRGGRDVSRANKLACRHASRVLAPARDTTSRGNQSQQEVADPARASLTPPNPVGSSES